MKWEETNPSNICEHLYQHPYQCLQRITMKQEIQMSVQKKRMLVRLFSTHWKKAKQARTLFSRKHSHPSIFVSKTIAYPSRAPFRRYPQGFCPCPKILEQVGKTFQEQLLQLNWTIHGATLKGRLLAFPADIREGWKDFPGTTARAYLDYSWW
jgi:hypothetical protein